MMESRRTSERKPRKAKNVASSIIRRVASGLDWDSSPTAKNSMSKNSQKNKETAQMTRMSKKSQTSKVVMTSTVNIRTSQSKSMAKAASGTVSAGAVRQTVNLNSTHSRIEEMSSSRIRTVEAKSSKSARGIASRGLSKKEQIIDLSESKSNECKDKDVQIMSETDCVGKSASAEVKTEDVLENTAISGKVNEVPINVAVSSESNVMVMKPESDKHLMGVGDEMIHVASHAVEDDVSDSVVSSQESISCSDKIEITGSFDGEISVHTSSSETTNISDILPGDIPVDKLPANILYSSVHNIVKSDNHVGDFWEPIPWSPWDHECFPSCDQHTFLNKFGLGKTSEVQAMVLRAEGSRLHRKDGGILRHLIKPSVVPRVVSRRKTSAKGSNNDCHVSNNCADLSESKNSIKESSHRGSNKRHHAHVKRVANESPRPAKIAATDDVTQSSCVSSDQQSSSVDIMPTDSSEMEQVSALDFLADMALADHAGTLQTVQAGEPSHAKSKVSPKTSCCDEILHGVRRSSRNSGQKRRVWHHLLRANPDEHDPCEEQSNKEHSDGLGSSSGILARNPSKAGSVRQHTGKFDGSSTSDLTVGSDPDSLKKLSTSTSITESGHPVQAVTGRKHRSHHKTVPPETMSKKSGMSLVESGKDKFVSLLDVLDTNVIRDGDIATFDYIDRKDDAHDRLFESSILSYSYKELECLTPHMCNVCWVNDHMYCRNMKRIARDLPNFSGCIHYIACAHYRTTQSDRTPGESASRTSSSRSSLDTCASHSMSFHWAGQGLDKEQSASRVVSAEDLICTEDMLESDPDSSSHSIEGTELLQIQLKARTAQIFQSLGINELPNDNTPTVRNPKQQMQMEMQIPDDDLDLLLEPAEYAAEVCIDLQGGTSSEILPCSELTSADIIYPFMKAEREEVIETCNEQSSPSNTQHLSASNAVDEMDTFDEVHHLTLLINDGRTVDVGVQKTGFDQAVVSFPGLSSQDNKDSLQLEVSFPGGITEEALHDFLTHQAVHFIGLDDGHEHTTCVDGSCDRLTAPLLSRIGSRQRPDTGKILMVRPKKIAVRNCHDAYVEDLKVDDTGSLLGKNDVNTAKRGRIRADWTEEVVPWNPEIGSFITKPSVKPFAKRGRIKTKSVSPVSVPLDLRINLDRDKVKTDKVSVEDYEHMSVSERAGHEMTKLQADLEKKMHLRSALMFDVARSNEQLRQQQLQIAKYDQENILLQRQYNTLFTQLSAIDASVKCGQQFIHLLEQLASPDVMSLSHDELHSEPSVIPLPVQTFNMENREDCDNKYISSVASHPLLMTSVDSSLVNNVSETIDLSSAHDSPDSNYLQNDNGTDVHKFAVPSSAKFLSNANLLGSCGSAVSGSSMCSASTSPSSEEADMGRAIPGAEQRLMTNSSCHPSGWARTLAQTSENVKHQTEPLVSGTVGTHSEVHAVHLTIPSYLRLPGVHNVQSNRTTNASLLAAPDVHRLRASLPEVAMNAVSLPCPATVVSCSVRSPPPNNGLGVSSNQYTYDKMPFSCGTLPTKIVSRLEASCISPPLTHCDDSESELFDYQVTGDNFRTVSYGLQPDTLTPDPSCSSQD